MISKAEFDYLKSKIKALKDKHWSAQLDPRLAMWETWQKMSAYEQFELKKKWSAYYQQARSSDAFKLYWKAKTALHKNDIATVHELAKQAKDVQVSNLKKPSTEDPELLHVVLAPYFNLCKKLKDTEALIEEYSPVYDKSSKEFAAL